MNDRMSLLKPYKLNNLITLKNHIVMAPMTRCKATDDLVPTQEMVEYYARRADAGLLITEGTIIREDGLGYANVPGIFTEAQINGWRKVTDAVHSNNGLIFSQIWHVGRVSHPHFLKGNLPISPSKTMMSTRISRSDGLMYGESRALTQLEIKELIKQYVLAAKNAIKAGFDGVEIHGANGYLIDQFLHYHTNKRDDEYGGSAANMARFALEVVKACGEAIGYERLGLRLSPGGYLNEIVGEARDADVFKYLLEQLNHTAIAYVHVGSFDDSKTYNELANQTMSAFLRANYKGKIIACGSYSFDKAEQQIQENKFDLVAIGRPFIANPDLIQRFKAGQAIKAYDPSMLATLY